MCRRRGRRSMLFVYSVRADSLLSTSRAMKLFSGIRASLVIKWHRPQPEKDHWSYIIWQFSFGQLRKRHSVPWVSVVSDRKPNEKCQMINDKWFLVPVKAGEPSHFWLGPKFGGMHWRVARKVAGAAAGGAQGKMAAGHSQRVSYIPCVPISYWAHLVPQSGRDSIEFQFFGWGRLSDE